MDTDTHWLAVTLMDMSELTPRILCYCPWLSPPHCCCCACYRILPNGRACAVREPSQPCAHEPRSTVGRRPEVQTVPTSTWEETLCSGGFTSSQRPRQKHMHNLKAMYFQLFLSFPNKKTWCVWMFGASRWSLKSSCVDISFSAVTKLNFLHGK